MRVMMISKALVVGAYQRKLEEIADHDDVTLTVVVPPYWNDARGKLELEQAHIKGYELLVEDMRFNGSFHWHTYPGLRHRVTAFRPDIIHIDEEPYNPATYQAMRLAQRVSAKTVFFSWQNLHRRYPPPFSLIERYTLRHADHGIVGNTEAAEVWRGKGFAGPLTVIPQFGVDPDIFSPGDDARPDVFTIGYAGRLVEDKGLDLLIRAAARLPGRVHVKLAGDGPDREALHTLAGVLNIGGSVEIVGSLPSAEMPDFYRSVDVVALPSRTRPNWKEQFGRMLVEAMACGVPVVGSDSGAIPDVIGDAGLIFPEDDEDALVSALGSLLEHPRLRTELGAAGQARVLDRFTQAQVARETVEVYRAMLR